VKAVVKKRVVRRTVKVVHRTNSCTRRGRSRLC
jgi:hypothetical protein